MNLSKHNTLIKEAIILAGGLGTRLKDTVPDVPKCMAPVAGHPFIAYVIRYYSAQGIDRFIFSLGYKADMVQHYLRHHFPGLDYVTVVEDEPLKTGGAIVLALKEACTENVLILNGDTLFKVRLHELANVHQSHFAECTLALKPMQQFDRYGSVVTGSGGRILSFEEKKFKEQGNINGGVYILHKPTFLAIPWPQVFSFEADYLEKYCQERIFYGMEQHQYFIDIGVPEDFNRAQQELRRFPFPEDILDRTWTLFLDRDGVININKDDGYILNRNEFIFKEGALEALCILSEHFDRIFVVTNQRGVGKGLMSQEDLDDIHDYMLEKIKVTCGRVDDIFYCTSTDNDHPDRKPNPGMAHTAKAKYPSIDFSKSIMIGDKNGDMQWGRSIGALTVWITSKRYELEVDLDLVDLTCASLFDFAHVLQIHG